MGWWVAGCHGNRLWEKKILSCLAMGAASCSRFYMKCYFVDKELHCRSTSFSLLEIINTVCLLPVAFWHQFPDLRPTMSYWYSRPLTCSRVPLSDSCRQALRHRTLSSCRNAFTHVHTREREETVWQWISNSCRWSPPFKKNAEAAVCPSAAASGMAEKVHKCLQSLNIPPFVPPHLHVFLSHSESVGFTHFSPTQSGKHTHTHTRTPVTALTVYQFAFGMWEWGGGGRLRW